MTTDNEIELTNRHVFSLSTKTGYDVSQGFAFGGLYITYADIDRVSETKISYGVPKRIHIAIKINENYSGAEVFEIFNGLIRSLKNDD